VRSAGGKERDEEAGLGRAIRTARQARGMTLEQVAAHAGLSQPFLSQLELGRTLPSMRSLSRIANALGTTQQALLGRAAGWPRSTCEPVRGRDAALVDVEAGRARQMPEQLSGDPLAVLARWVTAAEAAGLPRTMTFATADADGVPHARTVVCTGIATDGVHLHSSTPTTKTRDLAANPRASAVFHWPALGRQVVLQGGAAELDAATSRAGFRTQPRQLQLLAWAYEALLPQLRAPDFAVPDGAVERAFAAAAADPASTEAPPSWTTIRLEPDRMDFWQGGTETSPQTKIRFVRESDGWRHFPVLP
jgi:pyridoxamine 5'-phosphate oxidase